ncbi:VOC family protein [Candidatus Sumerlaeota bacterium]|nr:VOC family protein [Candidatus Sumerlaeota bacterium]
MLSTPARTFADKIKMQHQLFAELSAMFGREVPLYDKSLLVNRVTNEAVCDLLGRKYRGFSITEEQLEKTSGERHGAIRIGTPEEYRWVAGFFAAFGMYPHNFYDMTSLGGKSQPIIATAFRSPINPEHRVFTSLLMVDYFSPEIAARIGKALAKRRIFSDRAKELILRNEEEGGLSEEESAELVKEGTTRIFKWLGKAHDHKLYKELSDTGFKIAADIACFESHHLNHLTPNTLCMDLYTAAMKHTLGEIDRAGFTGRAVRALKQLRAMSDRDWMKIHFRHLSSDDLDTFADAVVGDAEVEALAASVANRLSQGDLDLGKLKHSGYKDFTEGPSDDTPILLRQDAYKALTEPVVFIEEDGSTVNTAHTARFGEIEQRFYATTAKGRALYDECLSKAEADRAKDPGLVKTNPVAYEAAYAAAFAPIPKTLPDLLGKGLVFARYAATDKGTASAGTLSTTNLDELVAQGFVRHEGLRYEDFLPFSAAGIFASNLGQYGTQSTAAQRPVYTQDTLERIMGRKIADPNVVYAGMRAESLLQTYNDLGILAKLPAAAKSELESTVAGYQALITTHGK